MSVGPLRGTQSFVAVMGEVRRRPGLILLELAWRWLAGGLILLVLAAALPDAGGVLRAETAWWQTASVFQPVALVHNQEVTLRLLLSRYRGTLEEMVPLACVLWWLAAGLGRSAVLQRMDARLRPKPVTMTLLTLVRAAFVGVMGWAWMGLLLWATRVSILRPAARGDEPSVVLFFGMAIVITLGLYVLTAVLSWPLTLAPLLAVQQNLKAVGALKAAFEAGPVWAKLVEINLVLCIVRLALVVLAMVMSASPLAFQTVVTMQFFALWWSAAGLLYLIASDYFHVVRGAAYLSLYRAYHAVD